MDGWIHSEGCIYINIHTNICFFIIQVTMHSGCQWCKWCTTATYHDPNWQICPIYHPLSSYLLLHPVVAEESHLAACYIITIATIWIYPKIDYSARHTNPIRFEKQIVCSMNRLYTAWACGFICHRCTSIRLQRNRVQTLVISLYPCFSCPPLPDFNYCETDFIHLHRRANYAQVCFCICLVEISAREQFPLTLTLYQFLCY